MARAPATDSVRRFSGLADRYARARPAYPPEAVDFVLGRCGLRPGSLLADVGSGTGIASRLFAARGIQVVGIEPNEDMRRRAEVEPILQGGPPPTYLEGRAEATGLPDGIADAVLAAQAFHWFDPEPTLREFHRILRPAGWAVLLWNVRDDRDPLTAGYSLLLEPAREASIGRRRDRESADALQRSSLFHRFETARFPNGQTLDEDGLVARALSASYAPKEPEAVERLTKDLRRLYRQHAIEGHVVLRYVTEVYLARRAAG